MDRAHLRIADLKQRSPMAARLMNVKIPGHLADAISALAEKLGTSKTEVVIALLNTGLEQAGRLRRGDGRKGK